jgi:hypothetical protein
MGARKPNGTDPGGGGPYITVAPSGGLFIWTDIYPAGGP